MCSMLEINDVVLYCIVKVRPINIMCGMHAHRPTCVCIIIHNNIINIIYIALL